MEIISLNAQLHMKTLWWRFSWTKKATPRRPEGGTHKTTSENFESMKLLKRTQEVDDRGRWWSIETRLDVPTGLVLERKKRITD